jgi:hypothetical protein
MRKLIVSLLVVVLAVLAFVPAQAAPTRTWLGEDANLYCGEIVANMDPVGPFVVNPQAGTLWVHDGEYAGHYLIVASEHYLVVEDPGTGPRASDDLLPVDMVDARTFGRKLGRTERVACQVVSPYPGFTVFAPMELALVR